MTPQSHFVQPPRLAVWLLTLFALDDEAESILGDLLEEFTLLASKSGVPFARRWYWRQTLKTVYQLADHGFRTAPWSTMVAVLGGFSLRLVLAGRVEPAIVAVLDRYQVYEHHFSTYMFFASTGIDIGHLITFLFVGFIAAFVARGREMVATISLGLFWGALTVASFPAVVMQSGYGTALSRGMVYFADSLVMVIAGVIVRTHRLGSKARHPQAY
jgi:hypothetical protein